MQAQVSAAENEQQLPRNDFIDRWLSERGLDRSYGVLKSLPPSPTAATSAFLGGTGEAVERFQIVTHDRSGRPRPELSRTRYDTTSKDDRYRSPARVGVVIYAPLPDSFTKFYAATEKHICEGEGKTMALVGLGRAALGIGGVWNWRGPQGGLHPDLLSGIRAGDIVSLWIDGDWRTNAEVFRGARQLMEAVRAVGAKVQLVDLPAIPGRGKVGIDDAIKYWRDSGENVEAKLSALPSLSHLSSQAIVCHGADEILARTPARWIVKDLIPAGELVALVGATNSGKTFLTMDLLLAVATERSDWFGHKIRRSGPVVHVTLEGTGLPDRLRAYVKQHGVTVPEYFAVETPVNLRHAETADALISAIREQVPSPILIAIDTVNRALGGGDENSSTDMGAFLGNCERIKAAFPDSAVVLVHHLGKDEGRGARGHSSFSANVGAEIQVSNDEKTGVRTARLGKQRDGRTGLTFHFALGIVTIGHDEDGDEITSCYVAPCARPQENQEISNETMYGWIYNWHAGSQNNSQPVSKETIRKNFEDIRPDGNATQRARLLDAFVWAINVGYAVNPVKIKNGLFYDLKPLQPREGKY